MQVSAPIPDSPVLFCNPKHQIFQCYVFCSNPTEGRKNFRCLRHSFRRVTANTVGECWAGAIATLSWYPCHHTLLGEEMEQDVLHCFGADKTAHMQLLSTKQRRKESERLKQSM